MRREINLERAVRFSRTFRGWGAEFSPGNRTARGLIMWYQGSAKAFGSESKAALQWLQQKKYSLPP